MVHAVFEMTVADTVVRIDVETDNHPHDQTNPGVGRQEEHQTDADQNTGYRNERHERGTESAGHVWHGLSYDEHAAADQGKGEQRTDTGHFAGNSGRYET